MDMFSYLLAKNKQDRKYDLTNIRNVINMTDADITSQTPFGDYPQDLYNGYINVLKDKYTLIDNMNKGTTTGETTDSANLPIYGGVLTKESTQVVTQQSANLLDENYYKTATYEIYSNINYIKLRVTGGRYLVFKASLKSDGSEVSGSYMYISSVAHSTSDEIIYAISNGSGITRSLEFSSTDLYLNIIGNVADIFDNYNIMLSTSDTSYVPFVPDSPSPDYPSTINVVTGDVDINVVGKNLFNPALLSQVSDYNTYDSTTGMWTTSSSIYFDRSIFYDVVGAGTSRDITKLVRLESGNYTIKLYDYINNTGATNGVSYSLFDSNGEKTGEVNDNEFVNLTVSSTSYLDIRRHSGEGTFSFSKIMIIKGTYTSQNMPEYEPYQGGTYQISLGTNEIAGIGDVKDELVIDKEGKCYINKKISKIASYDGETITTDYMSTTGGLDTGATIYYVADETTVIDLEQTVNIATCDGLTTITNSENMDMSITYIKNTYN